MWPLQGLLLALRKLQPLGERGKLQARVSAVSVSRPGKKPLPLLLLLSFSSFALSFSPALSCRSPFLPFVLTEEEEEEGGGRRKSNYKHAPCRYWILTFSLSLSLSLLAGQGHQRPSAASGLAQWSRRRPYKPYRSQAHSPHGICFFAKSFWSVPYLCSCHVTLALVSFFFLLPRTRLLSSPFFALYCLFVFFLFFSLTLRFFGARASPFPVPLPLPLPFVFVFPKDTPQPLQISKRNVTLGCQGAWSPDKKRWSVAPFTLTGFYILLLCLSNVSAQNDHAIFSAPLFFSYVFSALCFSFWLLPVACFSCYFSPRSLFFCSRPFPFCPVCPPICCLCLPRPMLRRVPWTAAVPLAQWLERWPYEPCCAAGSVPARAMVYYGAVLFHPCRIHFLSCFAGLFLFFSWFFFPPRLVPFLQLPLARLLPFSCLVPPCCFFFAPLFLHSPCLSSFMFFPSPFILFLSLSLLVFLLPFLSFVSCVFLRVLCFLPFFLCNFFFRLLCSSFFRPLCSSTHATPFCGCLIWALPARVAVCIRLLGSKVAAAGTRPMCRVTRPRARRVAWTSMKATWLAHQGAHQGDVAGARLES